MKTNGRITVAQAHKMLGTETDRELGERLGAKYQHVQYWRKVGYLPRWWSSAVRARSIVGRRK